MINGYPHESGSAEEEGNSRFIALAKKYVEEAGKLPGNGPLVLIDIGSGDCDHLLLYSEGADIVHPCEINFQNFCKAKIRHSLEFRKRGIELSYSDGKVMLDGFDDESAHIITCKYAPAFEEKAHRVLVRVDIILNQGLRHWTRSKRLSIMKRNSAPRTGKDSRMRWNMQRKESGKRTAS